MRYTKGRGTEHVNLHGYAEIGENKDFKNKLEFKPIIDQWIGDFTFLHNVGTKFFYLTNYKAPYNRLISLDIKFPQEENWKELLVGDQDNILTDVSFAFNKLIVESMTDTATQLKIFDMTSHEEKANLLHEVKLPGRGSFKDMSLGENDDNLFLFSFSTFTHPTVYYRLDLETFKLVEIYKPDGYLKSTGYNPDDYLYDLIEFKSKDGTMVPLSIIRKKEVLPTIDTVPAKPILTHLYAYGGFGNIEKPEFDPRNYVFFEKLGGIMAIAHIRGGGEKGHPWQEGGVKFNRQNHFDDFIGAAEWLISQNITSPQKLVVSGASNGGVLMATVAN